MYPQKENTAGVKPAASINSQKNYMLYDPDCPEPDMRTKAFEYALLGKRIFPLYEYPDASSDLKLTISRWLAHPHANISYDHNDNSSYFKQDIEIT